MSSGFESCRGATLPSLEHGGIRFAKVRAMPEGVAERLASARLVATDTTKPVLVRARAFLDLADLQWTLRNEREAADAALVALRYVPTVGRESRTLTHRACTTLARFAAKPYRTDFNYATPDFVPDDLEPRCVDVLGPAWAAVRYEERAADGALDGQCIEVAECARDGLDEPRCTERVFAAACGQLPEADTCGCHDIATLFGDQPPVHAEQLEHLDSLLDAAMCENWARSLAYIRGLEGTTLGATSAYARLRMNAELCGPDGDRWIRHFRLAVLEPDREERDDVYAQSPETLRAGWQAHCE